MKSLSHYIADSYIAESASHYTAEAAPRYVAESKSRYSTETAPRYMAEAASTHDLETSLYKFVESLVKADSKEKFDAVIDDFESKYSDNKIPVNKVPKQFTNWDTLVYICKDKNLDGKKGVSYVCIDCFNADEATCEYKVMTYSNKFSQRAGLYDEAQDDDPDYTPMYLEDEYSTDLSRGFKPQFYLFKNVTNKILY